MKRVYLVDSENVGDVWVPLLVSIAEDEQVVVFYTQKSPHMSYENVRLLKETEREAEFIKCFEGSNALDFQLVTELGYRLNHDKNCEYVIVSNDTGFDAAVRYWSRLDMPVRRLSGKDCHKQLTQQNVRKQGQRQESGAARSFADTAEPGEATAERTEQVAVSAAEENEQTHSERADGGASESTRSRRGRHGRRSQASSESDATQSSASETVHRMSGTDFISRDSKATAAETSLTQEMSSELGAYGRGAAQEAASESGASGSGADAETAVESEQTMELHTSEPDEAKDEAEQAAATESGANAADAAAGSGTNTGETTGGAGRRRSRTRRTSNAEKATSKDGQNEPEGKTKEDASQELTGEAAGDGQDDRKAEKVQQEAAGDQRDADALHALCCCIGNDNLADFHNALVMLFGEETGKEKYQELKSNPEYAAYWKEMPVHSQEEKFDIYCRLVFAGSEIAKEEVPADFAAFLWKANGKRKNLNSLRAALLGHYGKEKGMKYYSLFKSHIKIMNRM